MRQARNNRSRSVRPLVGIAADGASSYGRGLTRGAMEYINGQRKWEVHTELRHTFAPSVHWPRCDGAIIAGVGPDLATRIEDTSRYVISCSGSGRANPSNAARVCLDDVAAGTMAAEHLLDCQLDLFSFYGRPGAVHSTNREHGFIAAITGHNCTYLPCPVQFYAEEIGMRPHWPALINWLKGLERPIGIMAVDDTAAVDIAAACRHAEIGVPERVAIVGVNNDDLVCDTAWSPISSVDAGFPRIGFAAAQLLERLLNGEKLSADERLVRLPPLQVVRRLSTDILAVDEPQVADAVRYIREHACDPCSVEEVLRHVPTGRRWLERQFEKKLGRSPGEEILRVQLQTARRLLLRPEIGLEAVAEKTGFSCSPALSRAFRRTFGKTPAAYRRDAIRRSH